MPEVRSKTAKSVRIELPEIPPDLNKIVGMATCNRYLYGQEKKRWKEMMRLLSCRLPRFTEKVDIYLTCVFGTKAHHDRDNYWACFKFILDGLACIEDDNSDLVEPHLNPFQYEKGQRRAYIDIIKREPQVD